MFLMLAMFLVGTVANAQIVTSHSKLVTKVKKPPFEKTFYLAGGGKLNTAENKYYKFNFGYEAAFGYEQNFKREHQFGSQWGMEVGLTSRGWKYEQMGQESNFTTPSVFISPFTYSYRVGSGRDKKTWIEPHVGVYLCYDLKDDPYEYNWTQRYSHEPSLTLHNSRGERGDVGFNLGVRFWFARRVSLDLAYQQGILTFANCKWEGTVTRYSGDALMDSWQYNGIHETHDGRSGSIVMRIGVKLNKNK